MALNRIYRLALGNLCDHSAAVVSRGTVAAEPMKRTEVAHRFTLVSELFVEFGQIAMGFNRAWVAFDDAQKTVQRIFVFAPLAIKQTQPLMDLGIGWH